MADTRPNNPPQGAQGNLANTFYMTEIPMHFDKQDVVNILKEKIGKDQEYLITIGNYLSAKNDIPYKWGVFKMKNAEDAQEVVEKFPFLSLDEDGKILSRIMKNDRSIIAELLKHPERSICVKNLSEEWDHDKLQEVFEKFGPITCCKVSKTFRIVEGGATEVTSNKYGFVAYDNPEDAAKAIEGTKDETFKAEPYEKKAKSAVPQNNLFVKNIPVTLSEQELGKMFETFGKLGSFTVMRDEQNNSKGFGFVCFEDAENATKAIEAMHGKKLDGCAEPLYVQHAIKKEARLKALKKSLCRQNLYVKGIPTTVTEDDLKQFFGKFGEVKNTKIMVTETGKDSIGNPIYQSKGFGFVCFMDQVSAAKVIEQYTKDKNSLILNGQPLIVNYYESKDERKNKLERQHQSISNQSEDVNQLKQFSAMF